MTTTIDILSAAGKRGGAARKHRWTEEERDIVRRDYRGTNASARPIAARLGVTIWAVKGQVQKLGIAMEKSPDWTTEEENQLAELITRFAPITIAKKLHRSLNAVVVKAKRLGLSRRTRDGWYTMRDVCEILGVDHHLVGRWIGSGALKASWHTEVEPGKLGGAKWHIEESDLRQFIIGHCCELMGRNVDLFTVVHILVPNQTVFNLKETSVINPTSIYREGEHDA